MRMGWQISPSAQEIALLLEAGFVYRYASRFEEAREIFQGVRALQPESELPEVALAGLSFDEQKFDDAIAHNQAAIQLNPQSALAHAQLAEVQIFQRGTETARANIRKALELDPTGKSADFARSLLKLIDIVPPGRS
jgi:tetratricopeptide (TPR) repeat protein